jgi:hypothetical protein
MSTWFETSSGPFSSLRKPVRDSVGGRGGRGGRRKRRERERRERRERRRWRERRERRERREGKEGACCPWFHAFFSSVLPLLLLHLTVPHVPSPFL